MGKPIAKYHGQHLTLWISMTANSPVPSQRRAVHFDSVDLPQNLSWKQKPGTIGVFEDLFVGLHSETIAPGGCVQMPRGWLFHMGARGPMMFYSRSAGRVSAAVAQRRVISHPLSPCFSPCLLRTHPSHPILTPMAPTELLAALKPHAG